MSEIINVSNRRPTWWRRVRNVLLIGLVVFLAVWNLLPPNVIRVPVVLGRGDDGQLHDESPQPSGNLLHFDAHVGVLKSQNSTTMGSTESHSHPAFLADRSLVIVNQSGHQLMERVGTELLTQLKHENHFDRLEYYPLGHSPKPGGEAPDLVLRLDLISVQESGLAGRTLNAMVTATLGSSLAGSSYRVNDHLTPPIVLMDSEISIGHESSMTGIESSSAKYMLQGKDIAKQLATSVSGRLKTLREKHPPMPKFPASLRPEFQAAPEFAFVKRLNATCRTSSHGLMFRNETFWQFESLENAEPLLSSVRDELQESGWQVNKFGS